MARIHPLACVDSGAAVAEDVEIGPYCVVGPHVSLGARCRLLAQVHVAGHTTVGAGTLVHPFASLGGPPQSTGYRGEHTRLEIGPDCDIREGVTMSLGTQQGGGVTKIGARGFFMAYSHVGHDCRIGNDVIIANGAVLGGHCTVGDNAFLGGLAAVHQFGRIGAGAMLAGASGLRADLIPFATAVGVPAELDGLNIVGMKRRGMSREGITVVRRAYRTLFDAEGVLAERIERVATEYGSEPLVAEIIAFIRTDSRRPLCQPRMRARFNGDGGA